jgi:hypothetical protein
MPAHAVQPVQERVHHEGGEFRLADQVVLAALDRCQRLAVVLDRVVQGPGVE